MGDRRHQGRGPPFQVGLASLWPSCPKALSLQKWPLWTPQLPESSSGCSDGLGGCLKRVAPKSHFSSLRQEMGSPCLHNSCPFYSSGGMDKVTQVKKGQALSPAPPPRRGNRKATPSHTRQRHNTYNNV